MLEYTEKGDYAKTELRSRFLESRCPKKGNIRNFLMDLRVKEEELAKVGVSIDDKDCLSTIISSLPLVLSNFAAAQLAAPHMFSASKSIDPDVLISLLMEEADRQTAQQARRRSSKREQKMRGMKPSQRNRRAGRVKGRWKLNAGTVGRKGIFKGIAPSPSHLTRKTRVIRKLKPQIRPSLIRSARRRGAWRKTW